VQEEVAAARSTLQQNAGTIQDAATSAPIRWAVKRRLVIFGQVGAGEPAVAVVPRQTPGVVDVLLRRPGAQLQP
jgi:hypothetical protein